MTLHPVNKEEIQRKTRTFFRSRKWKELLVFLLFVAIAFVFWLMQYFQQTSDYDTSAFSRNPYPETTMVNDSLHGEGKEIPVRIDGMLSPANGYRFIDSLQIEPDKVWVYGDKKILDTLQWIYTSTLNEANIQKNINFIVKLQTPKGLSASVQKVRLTATLEKYAEKKFELLLICPNVPDDIHVRFFPSTVEIVCYISLNNYASLKAEDLEVGVDYNELLQNTNVNILPALLRKPQGLDDYRIVPETVEYLIEQKWDL
ncbi:MAG: hypothetical protein LBR97_05735 [Dysgonamonadaceae bacterium]|jgi:YbbR domain-containing protein|nr:hypothetical protein [Dysgonamonadaceae bacterium]